MSAPSLSGLPRRTLPWVVCSWCSCASPNEKTVYVSVAPGPIPASPGASQAARAAAPDARMAVQRPAPWRSARWGPLRSNLGSPLGAAGVAAGCGAVAAAESSLLRRTGTQVHGRDRNRLKARGTKPCPFRFALHARLFYFRRSCSTFPLYSSQCSHRPTDSEWMGQHIHGPLCVHGATPRAHNPDSLASSSCLQIPVLALDPGPTLVLNSAPTSTPPHVHCQQLHLRIGPRFDL